MDILNKLIDWPVQVSPISPKNFFSCKLALQAATFKSSCICLRRICMVEGLWDSSLMAPTSGKQSDPVDESTWGCEEVFTSES